MSSLCWKIIESQDDLDFLNSKFEGEEGDDVKTLEFFGLLNNESYFPKDISRSGYELPNIHLLVEVPETDRYQRTLIEIVLIACDESDLLYLSQPHFLGKVDTLKRVYLEDRVQIRRMRCARLLYRIVKLDRQSLSNSSYFKNSASIEFRQSS